MSTWGQDIMNPDFTFGSWLPQANDPNFPDYQAYLDWLAANQQGADWNDPAFAPPGTFTTPDGQTMQSAGYHGDLTAGEYAASHLNNKFLKQGSRAIDRLGMMNYLSMHPDEAKAAINAYDIDPQTGLPVQLIDDSLYALIERQLGLTPDVLSAAPEHGPGSKEYEDYWAANDPYRDKTPAQIAAENAAAAKAATLAAHMHNGHPDPGWMVDPTDPTNIIPIPGSGSENTGIFAPGAEPPASAPPPDGPPLQPISSPVGPDYPSDTLDPANGATPDPGDKQLLGVGDEYGATPSGQVLHTYAGVPDEFSHLPAIVANYFRKRKQPIAPTYGYGVKQGGY